MYLNNHDSANGNSQINPLHAFPHPNSLISILMSSSCLCLGLPSDLFPSGFPTKTLYLFFSFHTCYVLRPSHLPRRNHLYNIWLTLQILKLPFTKFSQSSSHFLPLVHKPLPQHPIPEHPHLCSCLNVSDQVSHPYKTTSKITVLYIVIFTLLGSKQEDKRFCSNDSRRVVPCRAVPCLYTALLNSIKNIC